MKKINSKGLQYLKFFHLLFIISWVGGAFSMAIISWSILFNEKIFYSNFLFMKLLDDFLIIPSAVFTVIIGLIYGILTNWGFLKFKWIIIKWIITIFQIIFGSIMLGPLLENIVFSLSNPVISNSFIIFKKILLLRIAGTFQLFLFIIVILISILKPMNKRMLKKI